MKVLLSHGYFLIEDEKEKEIMRPYPPLGLLYVSAFLNQKNIKHEVFDSTYSSYNDLLRCIEKNQPKIIAIYTNLMTKIKVVQLLHEIHNNPKYGHPKIILGGPDVTFNIKKYLNAGADYLVLGEGEETTYELCDALLNQRTINNIPGLAFLHQGEVHKTIGRIKIKDLSELPLPNRDAIDVSNYLDTWKKHHGKSSMTMSTQRGCPYTCKWCSTAVYGQSYRRRPAKQVVEEMAMIKEKYKPDAIWFVDDVFTVSHKWLAHFFDELKAQQVNIPFECITRAERLNKDLLRQLKEAGCFRIWIGAESGSQKIVDHMDRRVDVQQVKEVIQMTNEIGIESGTFIMVGYPTETMEDIKKTVKYLKEAAPSQFTITKAYPIKGTALYDEVSPYITTKLNWETSTDRDIDFKRTYPSKFYDFAIQYVLGKTSIDKKRGLEKFKSQIKLLYHSTRMHIYSLMANK